MRAACSAVLLAVCAVVPRHIIGASGLNQNPQDPLPDAPGKATVVVVCASCHDVDTAIGLRRTSAEWRDVIDSMINRGASASEDEFKTVAAYLAKNFGLVNVNTAPAKEIEDVLEISSEAAAAIVRARMDRGSFADLESLKMVAGVDAAVIDKRKERIKF